jgi:Predicted oxidoreductases (related to aryl-alcohol dehydrogenases)
MHPAFLEDQLETSLTNIGIETLDLYYLHNAAEGQMPLIGHDKFMDKLAVRRNRYFL